MSYLNLVIWNTTVSIATRYWLDGLGIKPWWEWDFLYPFRLALWLTQNPIQWLLGHSLV